MATFEEQLNNLLERTHSIKTDYDLSIVEQRMLNPEFAELVKVGKTYFNGQANENLDIAVMENRAGTLRLVIMVELLRYHIYIGWIEKK